MRKFVINILSGFLIFLIVFVSLQGFVYIFNDPEIIIQSAIMAIVLNLIFAYFTKQEIIAGNMGIIKGGFIDRILDDKGSRYKYLALLLVPEILVLSYAYSPGGEDSQKLVGFALIIPLILSAALINGK